MFVLIGVDRQFGIQFFFCFWSVTLRAFKSTSPEPLVLGLCGETTEGLPITSRSVLGDQSGALENNLASMAFSGMA